MRNDLNYFQIYLVEMQRFFRTSSYSTLYRLLKIINVILLGIPFAVFSTTKFLVLTLNYIIGMALTKALAATVILLPVSLILGIVFTIVDLVLHFLFTILLWPFFLPELIA